MFLLKIFFAFFSLLFALLCSILLLFGFIQENVDNEMGEKNN